MTVLLGFVLAAVAQFLLYGFYRARLAAHRRLTALLAPDAALPRYRPSSFRNRSGEDDLGGGDDPETEEDESTGERGPMFPNGLDCGGGGGGGYSALDAVEMTGACRR